MNTNGELRFYPEHPSDGKTHQIETGAMPILKQEMPFQAKNLYEEFIADEEAFFAKYVDKRFEITGIAKKVGPDIHNKPSIEISDCVDGQTYALVIFPTNAHYAKVQVGDLVVVRANYLVMSNHYGTVMKFSELVSVKKKKETSSGQGEQVILNYPFFNGEKVIENAAVVVENGVIAQIIETENIDHEYFLVPGFIDAHTHMGTTEQVKVMVKNGVTATCDVAAPVSLVDTAKPFTIVSSAGMTMGTLNGKSYVKKAIDAGAKYIKVLLMEPNLMLKSVLKDICKTAHDSGLKVAVHAVSVKAVQMSVECGVDILIHVPMKEEYPEALAREIAERGIVVVPTLVMMETFAHSGQNGYKEEHYQNAEHAVKLLYENGVKILVGTDANPGAFAPEVKYGTSMHREMELLVKAGMPSLEVLSSATCKIAEVFGIKHIGAVEEGNRADFVIVKGRPDKDITDTAKIHQVWIDGKKVM